MGKVYPQKGGRMEMKRMGRREYFIKIAKLVAERSTCERAKVGAVIVHDKKIVATGYNGSAPESVHCIDEGCLIHNEHCIRTIHAELNAILHLERNYDYLYLYCTHKPCIQCVKAMVTAGVQEVFYLEEYEDEARDKLLEELSLILFKVDEQGNILESSSRQLPLGEDRPWSSSDK